MIFKASRVFAISLFFSLIGSYAFAQDEDGDHSVVWMLGGAIDQNVSESRTNLGPTVSAEFNVIDDWLEVEVGTQFLTTKSPHELGGQVIFKKPFQLSPDVEFMVGAGPTIDRPTSGYQGNQYGVALAMDLMVWTTKDLGWFVSPEYNYGVGISKDRSIGLSVGLIFGM
jgi:hypothetical protein